ncbi:polysialyltransferase family glycosyltransferase [Legionella quateirensis]|uniref:Uncharacterized protein n=1 Tax=Legionella quateirensis TaxID=45072 RepID=A0A378KWT9_9GAMM|nr:polysialyltransferase family glycosyltransferase [Legionella quateirensis]KTD47626.1 hypothetical protein Lqua_2019 [Legionella quateirensis]STY18619.1 Uncharacterised protein [Legionella quateirensis]
MNNVSLISIDHINQLIPAYAALKYARIHKKFAEKPLVILTKPHIPFNTLKCAHIQSLMSNETNVILINGYSLFKYPKLMTYLPVRLRSRFLFSKLKKYTIDEFFFSHDISSDFWNQTLMHAFPYAKRICYGDALGLVYTQNYFTQLMYRIKNKNKIIVHNIFARIKRKFLYPAKTNQLMPQEAILAIPCDPGKDFLTQCKLSIINQKDLKHCVEELAATIPQFKTHMHDVISNSDKPCYLLMFSNFTESKLTTLEHEIALYQEILKTHAQKDSVIIIKPHPAHNPELFKQIIAALNEHYSIQIIDKDFYHLPIELAESLVQGCEVLSVSYSSISLPYIYDKKVTHVLTQELINTYFSIEKMSWFIESNNLYLKMIDALQHWTQEHELPI